jgi:hypothetical protein
MSTLSGKVGIVMVAIINNPLATAQAANSTSPIGMNMLTMVKEVSGKSQ